MSEEVTMKTNKFSQLLTGVIATLGLLTVNVSETNAQV